MIEIPRDILDRMVAHGLRERPLEACGLLTGRRAGEIESVVPMVNALGSPDAFSIAPLDLFEFFRGLRTQDSVLTGIYHSHPHSAAVPSAKDVREFHYPEVSYWIVSLDGKTPDVRCYRWVKMGFHGQSFAIRDA